MNEQRQQAYFNLIQSLLNCHSHDEVREILAANQELVDVGFLQAVEAAAAMFSQQGYENTANWLQGLAIQLGEALNLNTTVDLQSLSEEELQAYFQFLIELLQATADSKGNTQVVYPLLANNTDKLDEVLAEILHRWGTNTLGEAQADEAEYLATAIVGFSNLIQQFPLGNKASNMEIAITGYEVALTVYTQQAFPYNWAMTQNNLGGAYLYRIREDKAENLERAIACLQEALKVYTFDAFPYNWARTQNNLGLAYFNRIKGDKAENLEQGIACLQEALKVITFDAFPVDWAGTQNNLANAYLGRIRGDKAENLERAIACLQEALKIRTFDAFPVDCAATQNNLGGAYLYRIRGDKAENLEKATTCYHDALKVRTFEAFPQTHAQSLWNLGMVYQEAKQLTSAFNTFESAIATVESLREKIVSGEESKRKQAEEWNGLYSSMVEICLELSNTTEAIEYVERSKTRNLVEQILSRDLKTIFPADVVTQLEKYRDEIATGQFQIQNGKAENPKVLAQHLQELRQQRNKLQNRYLPVGYGFKFDSLQATLNERTALIEWYILYDKVLAFLVTPTLEVTVWQFQPEDQQAFIDWAAQYLQNYYNQKDQWQNSLGEELKKLASILHIDEILTQIPNHCDQLILIPHRFLHLLPLHVLPITSQKYEDSPCLLDLFAGGVSYAPSCQILQQVQQRKRPDFQSLFAIQNPTEDLNYTDLEVQVIQSYFNTSNVLKKTAATLTAINGT